MRYHCLRIVMVATLVIFCLPALAQLPIPGYNSHWRNKDGSEKFAIAFAGGWDVSHGNTRAYQTRGWNYLMESGYNFNRHLAMLGEYSYNRFSDPNVVVNNGGSLPDVYEGPSHIWTLTVEPKYQYYATETIGAYVIGGGGFARKTAPELSCQGNLYSECVQNGVDTAVWNVGAGVAWKISENANVKAFLEVRYVNVLATGTTLEKQMIPLNMSASFTPVSLGFRW
jgi:hypothetical protein